MSTKKYVSLDKLSLYDEKIKGVIAAGDTAALDAAKLYADGLAKNYEAAGAVATAQEALQKNIDAVQTNVDLAAAAAAAAQSDVDALEALVGALPEGTAATSVVDYVNVKTAGIATDAALGELNNQVSALQGTVNGITADYLKAADKTELSNAIATEAARADAAEKANAAAIKAVTDDYLKAADMDTLQGNIDEVAEDVANIAKDYLVEADKTELSGAIALKADQTALDDEVQRATGIEGGLRTDVDAIKGDYLKAADKTELQGNIDTLTGVVETLRDGIDADKVDGVKDLIKYVEEHGTEVTGMQEDIADNAEAIAGVAGRMDTAEGKITAVEGAVATKVEQSAYDAKVAELAGADTAMAGRLDNLEAINHDAYVDADTALKNELNGEIAKKADTSVVEAMDAAYKEADAGIIERVAAVEALMGDGEGSVADQIADVKAELQGEMATAIADAKTDASNKDAVVLAEAQAATAAVQTALDTHTNNGDIHVTAEQKTAWTTAAGKAHEHSNLSVLEGITAAKITAWDGAEAAAKAEAARLDGLMNTRVLTLETWHENFVECSQEDINGLFA
jgi:hypothetical protein